MASSTNTCNPAAGSVSSGQHSDSTAAFSRPGDDSLFLGLDSAHGTEQHVSSKECPASDSSAFENESRGATPATSDGPSPLRQDTREATVKEKHEIEGVQPKTIAVPEEVIFRLSKKMLGYQKKTDKLLQKMQHLQEKNKELSRVNEEQRQVCEHAQLRLKTAERTVRVSDHGTGRENRKDSERQHETLLDEVRRNHEELRQNFDALTRTVTLRGQKIAGLLLAIVLLFITYLTARVVQRDGRY